MSVRDLFNAHLLERNNDIRRAINTLDAIPEDALALLDQNAEKVGIGFSTLGIDVPYDKALMNELREKMAGWEFVGRNTEMVPGATCVFALGELRFTVFFDAKSSKATCGLKKVMHKIKAYETFVVDECEP